MYPAELLLPTNEAMKQVAVLACYHDTCNVELIDCQLSCSLVFASSQQANQNRFPVDIEWTELITRSTSGRYSSAQPGNCIVARFEWCQQREWL